MNNHHTVARKINAGQASGDWVFRMSRVAAHQARYLSSDGWRHLLGEINFLQAAPMDMGKIFLELIVDDTVNRVGRTDLFGVEVVYLCADGEVVALRVRELNRKPHDGDDDGDGGGAAYILAAIPGLIDAHVLDACSRIWTPDNLAGGASCATRAPNAGSALAGERIFSLKYTSAVGPIQLWDSTDGALGSAVFGSARVAHQFLPVADLQRPIHATFGAFRIRARDQA